MTQTIDTRPSLQPAVIPTTAAHGHPHRTARITLAVVCVTTAMLMLDIAVVNTALTRIATDLHAGLSGVQWVVDAYTLALAALVLTTGSLADRLGRRRVLFAGLGLFVAGSVACAAAQGMGVLIAARAVQGAGAAALFAVSLPLLGHAFPDRAKRAGALAVYGATIGGAFAVGPLVGGLLTQHAGWRWIFLINAPIGVLCLALAVAGVRESRDPHPRRVDVAGQLVSCAALFLLVFALLRGHDDGWGSAGVVGSLAGAGVLLVAFLVIEARVADPMLPFDMFGRAFTATQIAAFGISASLFAVFLYVTLYLQGVLGLSPVEAGAVYLPGTVLMFVVAGATAQLQARIPAGVALVASLAVVGVGLALMALMAGEHSSWTATLPGFLVACAGTGVFNPVMSGLVLNESSEARAGLATGINDSFRQTGIAVGVAALGAFVPAHSAFGADPAGFVTGLHRALYVGCAVAVVAAAVAAVLFARSARRV